MVVHHPEHAEEEPLCGHNPEIRQRRRDEGGERKDAPHAEDAENHDVRADGRSTGDDDERRDAGAAHFLEREKHARHGCAEGRCQPGHSTGHDIGILGQQALLPARTPQRIEARAHSAAHLDARPLAAQREAAEKRKPASGKLGQQHPPPAEGKASFERKFGLRDARAADHGLDAHDPAQAPREGDQHAEPERDQPQRNVPPVQPQGRARRHMIVGQPQQADHASSRQPRDQTAPRQNGQGRRGGRRRIRRGKDGHERNSLSVYQRGHGQRPRRPAKASCEKSRSFDTIYSVLPSV